MGEDLDDFLFEEEGEKCVFEGPGDRACSQRKGAAFDSFLRGPELELILETTMPRLKQTSSQHQQGYYKIKINLPGRAERIQATRSARRSCSECVDFQVQGGGRGEDQRS